MRRACIIDIIRSPFGKGRSDGILAGLHPVDLYAQVLQALEDRNGIDPAQIEDVITGCVIQVAEQSGNIGRQAVLAAGWPDTVPAVTLDRKCGSAQQALHFAAQGIIAGAYDVVVAGGVEMMGLVPMRANRMGKDSEGPMFRERYPDGHIHQGLAAERIAAKWAITREKQDSYALRSHNLAAKAEDAGLTAEQIVAIRNNERFVERDEGLRRNSSLEKLAALDPAFRSEEAMALFPEISWSVTAGSSSQVSDGACAILLAEEATTQQLGLKPRAAVTHFSVAAEDPLMALTAIMPATEKLLRRANLRIADIDAFEVNEAFASVVLAWQKEFNVDPDRVNALGGAIALGHPVGASGGRLTANLLSTLETRSGRYGLQVMCESGGMANAMLIERV